MTRVFLPGLLLLASSACSKPAEVISDAGHDAGEVEPDAGPPDSGPTDAGPSDAGCTGNFHQCGSVCAFNGSTATCGDSCSPCPAVDNGTVTCDGTSCSFTCDADAGYHQCGSACVFEDGNSCGPTCMQCPAPAFATPLCEPETDGGSTCGVSCDGNLVACSDGTCGANPGQECGVDAGPCCTGACGTNGLCCAAPASNSPCTITEDCLSNACQGVDTSAFQCYSGLCCVGTGACSGNADCCTNNCMNGFCEAPP